MGNDQDVNQRVSAILKRVNHTSIFGIYTYTWDNNGVDQVVHAVAVRTAHLKLSMFLFSSPLEADDEDEQQQVHDAGFMAALRSSGLNDTLLTSTGGPETWSKAESWLATCLEEHEDCRRRAENSGSDPFYRPTRLLEMDSDGDMSFRLVQGASCLPGSRYIALSHCWGSSVDGDASLMLVEDTMNTLSSSQPVALLPKTFRDAFEVCRRLGISHLWIDRLCILQDSAEDWQREAASMRDVYKNAHLTISAMGAKDSSEGCFFRRDLRDIMPTRIYVRHSADAVPQRMVFDVDDWQSGWLGSLDGEPVLERGWIMQERLLSPRALHFGRKQVFWECSRAWRCEAGLLPWPVTARTLWKPLMSPYYGEEESYVPEREASYDADLFLEWKTVVRAYSQCKLTMPSDKLVALSGLAGDMRRALEARGTSSHRYHAGIWEATMPGDLCWYASIRAPLTRPAAYRAPSWSWASVDASIIPAGLVSSQVRKTDSSELQAALVSVETTSRLPDYDLGEVTGGQVTLIGPLAHLRVSLDTKDDESPTASRSAGSESPEISSSSSGANQRHMSHPRMLRVASCEEVTWPNGHEDGEDCKICAAYGVVIFDGGNPEDIHETVAFLVIRIDEFTNNHHPEPDSDPESEPDSGPSSELDPDNNTGHCIGLALVPTSQGAYRRVGCVRISSHVNSARLRDICKALPQKEMTIV